MIAPTHIVVGQFAYLVGALVAGHPPSAPEAVAAGAAALLPDIDKRSGYVGRWLPWLSGPIEEAVGHRTATHSLLALATVAVVAWPLPTGWYIAVVAGFGSHAIADMMTPSGVAWFWPARVRCVIPGNAAYRIEAMSIPELWVAVLVGLLSWPVLAMAQGGTGALGAVRDLIGDMGSARQHYDAHKSEADWWLTVRGQDNRGFQAVEGRYRVIAPFRATGLIVEGPRGPVSVCRSGECDWYVERAVIERGEPEVTTTRDVRLSQTTVDALREALARCRRSGPGPASARRIRAPARRGGGRQPTAVAARKASAVTWCASPTGSLKCSEMTHFLALGISAGETRRAAHMVDRRHRDGTERGGGT